MLDIRQRTGWIFFAVMLAQVLLVSAQVQTRSGVRVIEAVSFGAFSRVQTATSSVVNSVRDVWTNWAALRGARDENVALKQQLAEMEIKLQQQRALAARAASLQELLGLKTSTDLPTIAAEVIGGNPNAVAGVREITIDRGTADGVQASMAVIAPKGVVGRIIGSPARHASRVQLLIDSRAALGAITERTRVGGMVTASERGPGLMMDLVANTQDVTSGDLIVTSGIDGIYPRGYVIGSVERVERTQGMYLEIDVKPAVDFGSLEGVLVVLLPPRPAGSSEDEGVAPPPVSGGPSR